MGRWDRKKNAALTDCALNKGDTRLLMAVRIPPNEMTGIQCREMDIRRGRNTSENRTYGETGIPARTRHTGNGKQKIPHSTKKRKPFLLPLFCL